MSAIGSESSYGYDSLGNLRSKEGKTQNYSPTHPNQITDTDGTQLYTYDASGNVASLQRTAGASTYSFTYDSANRLKCSGTSGATSCNTL